MNTRIKQVVNGHGHTLYYPQKRVFLFWRNWQCTFAGRFVEYFYKLEDAKTFIDWQLLDEEWAKLHKQKTVTYIKYP